MGFLKPYENHTYALMRIAAGFLLLWHGSQKLLGFPPSGMEGQLPAHIHWIAGPIELVGGILVMIGLLTRPAAFLCSGLMAFAYWMGHAPRGGFLPAQNGGDLAVLFCFVFLYIAAKGPGIWSVDKA